MKKLMSGILALAFMLPLGGCDDDDLLNLPENDLTTEEALELAAALADQSYATASGEAANGAGAQTMAGTVETLEHGGVHFGRNVQATRPCPAGGDVTVLAEVWGATYPDEARIVVEMAGSKQYSACGFTARGREIIIDTDVDEFGFGARLEAVDGVLSGEQAVWLEGGFAWSTPTGRSGECIVDLYVVLDPAAKERRLSGSFCGTEIESTTTWTAD